MRTDTTRRSTHRNPPGFISYLTKLMDMLDEKQHQAISRNQYNHQSQKGGNHVR